jgi:heptosyltransferase-2/heptosyltransferase-3
MTVVRAYAFRKRRLRLLARAVDAVGDRLFHRAAGGPPPPPRKLLVIRLDHLGDVLFATPALRALRTAFPDAELTLLAGPWAADAVTGTGLVDRVQVVAVPWFARPRRRGGAGAWFAVWRWMRRERFDAALDLRGDVRHLAWLWAARIPVRIAPGVTGGGFLATHEIAMRAVHEVERNLDAVRVLVPAAVAGPLAAVVPAPQPPLAALAPPGRPTVLVHAGAGYATKRWEPEALAACVRELMAGGLVPVFVGTSADRALTAAVQAQLPQPAADAVGRTTLAELAALCARATAFLGHDSGPAHVAVASGIPCVLVYSGVNDPARWGPWGGRVRVLQHPVHCSPCGLARCPFAHECMRGIEPAAVARAVLDFVAATA